MRRFETEHIEDEDVSRLLRGLDSRTLELALDDEKYQRVNRFHELVYGSEPIAVEFDDETAEYQQPAFSALSLGGQLIGARHRKTTIGEITPLERHYAIVTGSLHSDQIDEWRVVPWRSLEHDQGLELTIEPAVAPPNLSVVAQHDSPHERALAEAARQLEQERLRLLTTRVLIGRQAWKLLGAGFVEEPLQGTYGLQQTVSYARQRGFTPQSSSVQTSAPEVERVDIYS